LAFLHGALRPGAVFLDIGAQLGLYSLVASRAVGDDGCVVAVEADPATYARLRHTVRVNAAHNIQTLNVGVSDQDGLLRFGLAAPPLRAASSFLREDGFGIDVTGKTLLAILREQHITRVDGAKLDIEGYEYRVLRRFLDEADRPLWPRFIITEFHADMVDQAGGNTLELLVQHGYQVKATVDVNSILVRDDP
jgi:FkbM family methyltransferase